MTILDDIGARDIRSQLPRRDWQIGTRQATTSITWHWNGPAVPPDRQHGAGLIAQLRIDSEYQMRPGWGGTTGGAPHLMYHLVVASDGQVYETAGIDEVLWHCAHQDGNARGLALHLAIGEGQLPTTTQLLAAIHVTNVLRSAHRIPLARVVGHLEWKHATLCPGPALMAHLLNYRASVPPVVVPTPTPSGLRRWQIRPDLVDNVNVRQGPGVGFKVASRMKPGTILFVDVEQDAEPHDPAHPRWVHMARVPNEQADLGFVAAELGTFL